MIVCQISIGRSVLINIAFVRKKEEMAHVKSDHFQSLVPRKEASIIVFMLQHIKVTSFKVSDPGRQKWSSLRSQADTTDIAPVVRAIPLACV